MGLEIKTPDGNVLMHAGGAYDPVKAHEYYMRTRHLKGRKKGSSYTVSTGSGRTVLTQDQLNEQKVNVDKRIKEIQGKLHELNKKLKEKMAEARKSEQDAKKGPTAADKREKAKNDKKYRDKHQQELSTKAKADSKSSGGSSSSKKSDTSVEGLKKTIARVKQNLSAAVEKQRALATATKN